MSTGEDRPPVETEQIAANADRTEEMKRSTRQRHRRVVWLDASDPEGAYAAMMALFDQVNAATDDKPQHDQPK